VGHSIRTRRLLAALVVSFALVPFAPAPGGAQVIDEAALEDNVFGARLRR
jgi:hypothetical protein